ncbi:sensor histidine kinase [Krasilnikoviella flava]|uniref:histidine kinase n=1 Tax=Krasilnikoviella flava TaxID=526729 RepID=A0A1T5JIQ8_9MICO|nr:histidine kinase [Krasilnikoviella flava]SKC51330.1 Histidine kinase [Krasilnikoviella flava]
MFARATAAPGLGESVITGRAVVLRWAQTAGTALAVAVSAASSLVAVGFASLAEAPTSAPRPALYLVSALVGLALAGLLVLRRRHPLALCLGASACSVLLPLDASAALLALPWVLATAAVRTCLAAAGATVVATAVALLRDALRDHEAQVLVTVDEQTHVLSPDPTAATYAVVGVGLLGVSVAAGLVRRAQIAADRARDMQQAQAAATAVLRDQVHRQEERRLIAREVHDTVAHHVAAISLQASALEVTSAGDPDAARAAREMRTSAQHAIGELRSLVTTLRSGDTVTGFPGATLDDLRPLLYRMAGDDPLTAATVSVSGGHDAAPTLVRATFRVVQEAVTNARKHAHGESLDVRVEASPDAGVDIVVRNPLPERASGDAAEPAVPGTGSGLLGMRERADAVGGTLSAGREGGEFVVRAHLPWIARAT